MIKIYSLYDELELSIIRGVFDAEGIHYFILNDHFGSMRVGPQMDLINEKSIMVDPDDVDRAKGIIANLIGRQDPEEEKQTKYSIGQILRMFFEAVLFGWFIPERKRRIKPPDG